MAKTLEHNMREALPVAETFRVQASAELDNIVRLELGQFLTPGPTAQLMASMFRPPNSAAVRLLDAGAGVGTLTAAWIDRIANSTPRPKHITAVVYEVDPTLAGFLEETMSACRTRCRSAGIELATDVRIGDFIEQSVDALQMSMFSRIPDTFDYAIVNPPYRKIRSDSRARALLRTIGVESTNLYTAFLSLVMRLLADRGELVMITPRSFCNGPYFRPFRQQYLCTIATQRVHIYESRKSAFKEDDVLQENVIFHGVKSTRRPRHVLISASAGANGDHHTERRVPYHEFVSPNDPDSFIHIVPEEADARIARQLRLLPASLDSLGISVSTGRVVDFRAREWLRPQPEAGTAPLIYPMHFENSAIQWPRTPSRKPNAIVDNDSTRDLLVPNDHYVVVKRFSAKEERRRVAAAVYDPRHTPCHRVGFENHLNYFHVNGRGLEPPIARGLAAFLNSTHVDRYFRQFNGHTQVNAADLRSLRYPTLDELRALGSTTTPLDQSSIDATVEIAIPALASRASAS